MKALRKQIQLLIPLPCLQPEPDMESGVLIQYGLFADPVL